MVHCHNVSSKRPGKLTDTMKRPIPESCYFQATTSGAPQPVALTGGDLSTSVLDWV